MSIRSQFDAGGPHAPLSAKEWGEAVSDAVDVSVSSTDVTSIVQLTQAEYDALSPADPDTLYVVVG